MGGFLSINVEEQYKKNEKFLQSLNEIAIERQIHLQNQMLERQKAVAIARSRDVFLWFTAFYVITATGLITGYKKTKKPMMLAALLPLTFIELYNLDLAYGNKMHRIRMEAEHIMTHEADLLEMPCGLPTASSIDQSRLDAEENKKIHPPLP